jgi:Tol biopolymer transport system component
MRVTTTLGCAFALVSLFELGATRAVAAPIFGPWSDPVNVAGVNSPDNDLSPFLSPNGLSLFFASNRPGGVGGEDLWVAQRASTADAFGSPVNLGAGINTDVAERSPVLSSDGLSLYFATTRPGGLGGFDIWVSKRTNASDDFTWSEPVNLGPVINSPGTDAGPGYVIDRATGNAVFYLASTRGGGLDIYSSVLAPDGAPGAVWPVLELNSPALDLTPALRSDGLEVIFASNRSGATGLWMSTRATTSDPWSVPVSLGPRFQIGSEAFPALSANGMELFFYSSRPGGNGSFDIYRSVRSEVPEPQVGILCGTGLLLLFARRRWGRLRTGGI